MFFSTIVAALLLVASASTCNAAPIKAGVLIVFSPRITYPKAGVTWAPGSTHNVTWAHPLATTFPLESGRVAVTVPKNAKTRDDYFVVRE
ncbi:hypothetical protein DXG03_007443 [Asterophora parasitica]|uniref:Uncharacterized protein n=1 Tax=Asterophora parasitica TaxID=117018 RepID=A0A9P7KAS4_9AGAR|nr:hypothetical protein DXG03_007443 [Asterophora parasitica]